MIQSLETSSIIRKHEQIDPWFPFRYSLDVYSGCEFSCPYCPVNWSEKKKVIYKSNFQEVFARERKALSEELAESSNSVVPSPQVFGVGGGYNDVFSPLNQRIKHTDFLLDALFKENDYPVIFTQNPRPLLDKLNQQWNRDGAGKLKKPFSVLVSIPSDEFTLDGEGKPLDGRVPDIDEKMKIIGELMRKGVAVGLMVMPIFSGFNKTQLSVLLHKFQKMGGRFFMLEPINQAGIHYFSKRKEKLARNDFKEERIAALSEMVGKMVRKAESRAKFELEVKQFALELALKTTLFPFLPVKTFENYLSPKDRVVACLGQSFLIDQFFYIGDGDGPKKIRHGLKIAAQQMEKRDDEIIMRLAREGNLQQIPGVGEYFSMVIAQMLLHNDFSFYYEQLQRFFPNERG